MGNYPIASVTMVDGGAWTSRVAEMAMCVFAAMVVLRLEMQRRAGGDHAGASGIGGGFGACKKILVHCAPEVAGVVACLTLAALLRAQGDFGTAMDEKGDAWEEIKRQWPLLLTADTLLSLQAMLRIVVFLSWVMRAKTDLPGPLTDEASALSLGANLCRSLLLVQSAVYMLDGPLGGNLPAVCEIAAMPLLAALGGLQSMRRNFVASGVVACSVAALASRHYLKLAEEAYANNLFLAAHMLDTLSAFTYLARSLLLGTDHDTSGAIVVGFTHLLMAAQASLSSYYFLQAFDYSEALVGDGLPYEVLQIGTTAQVGAYFGALVIFIAERFEGGGRLGGHQPDTTQQLNGIVL